MSTSVKFLAIVAALLGGAAVLATSHVRLPGNHQGYEPEQPIAFSHRQHAGELAIDCQYCHHGVLESRHAGIPSAAVCLNCHAAVSAPFDDVLLERETAAKEQREPRRIVSAEIRKLYDALALDDEALPIPGRTPRPIEWVRVHSLPDFVWFDHRPHVARGLACEQCHGPVSGMERLRQESSLSMGWCLQCHRTNVPDPGAPFQAPGGTRAAGHVSTDCSTCHF